MDSAVPDCLVTDWDGLETGLVLPAPKDRHVLAAAIRCQAGAIVSYNTRDFPESGLRQFGITAHHPDEFVEHAFGLSPAAVCKAVRDQRACLTRPTRPVDELMDTYLKPGLATTVAALHDHADLL